MPAQQPAVGIARCVVRGTANGRQIVNVFHVQNGAGSGTKYLQAGIDALCTALHNAYKTRFVSLLNALYSGDDVECTDLTDTLGVTKTIPSTITGSASGALIPQSLACCITWKIARRYRGGHPRTYFGPLGSASIEGPLTFSPTFLTSMLAAASGFLTDINAITAGGIPQRLVTLHRYSNGAQLVPPAVSPILSAEVDARLDSMRRRLGPDR